MALHTVGGVRLGILVNVRIGRKNRIVGRLMATTASGRVRRGIRNVVGRCRWRAKTGETCVAVRAIPYAFCNVVRVNDRVGSSAGNWTRLEPGKQRSWQRRVLRSAGIRADAGPVFAAFMANVTTGGIRVRMNCG